METKKPPRLETLAESLRANGRSPLGFLMTNWRDGTPGAFRMGSATALTALAVAGR